MAEPFWKRAIKPLEQSFGSITSSGSRSRRVAPTETAGAPGTAIYGGYVVENEKDSTLTGLSKYRTFSQILVNTSVVGAGVRYFLNLAAGAQWTIEAAEGDTSEEFKKLVEKALFEDPKTSWPRIVRRAAMYRFYGFSVQEWTAKRGEDGNLTFKDVAPRAQLTIEQWDVLSDGTVQGMIQRSPQDSEYLYLPRAKTVYVVDDTINDSPEGLGIFRHLVEPARRLNRYEQLEGFGFETDLRGVPVGRAPYSELRQAVDNNQVKATDAANAIKPIETFVKKHIKNPALGLLLDSEVYTTTDDATRPSNQPKYSMELLTGDSTSQPEMAKAIERINLEIARILGIESLLLGGGEGSFALAKDKTAQFSLMVDATLTELLEAFSRDLIDPLWKMNGWPEEMKPKMKVEAVQYRTIEEQTRAIMDMAKAGAPIMPDDPIVNFMRGEIGAPLLDDKELAANSALTGENAPPNPSDQDDEIPDEGAEE